MAAARPATTTAWSGRGREAIRAPQQVKRMLPPEAVRPAAMRSTGTAAFD